MRKESPLIETKKDCTNFESCIVHHLNPLEPQGFEGFFCCPEMEFSLIFSLIQNHPAEMLLISCSMRSALACFIWAVT